MATEERAEGHNRFATQAGRRDFEELQQEAKVFEELLGSRGWQLLRRYAKEAEEQALLRMVNGASVLSHQQYVHAAGKIEGIRAVLESPEAFLSAYRERERREIEEMRRRAEEGDEGGGI